MWKNLTKMYILVYLRFKSDIPTQIIAVKKLE